MGAATAARLPPRVGEGGDAGDRARPTGTRQVAGDRAGARTCAGHAGERPDIDGARPCRRAACR
uniref:Uncharacterized protein n=1 Tax=uncultured bacterium A1Q1_fos_1025 TaxID=1256537 RepID=L7VWA1_9BACT|nr:hypothetical protein [uncultured bacterium A1Q1_fos_1025]